MKLQAKKIEVESEGFDSEEFGMETNDPAVIQILLEKIYTDPYVWPRELLANWADAKGGGELTLPEVLDPNWIIEDHGEGMSYEFMTTKYTKIFHSTKRNSNEEIGGFGHGRLSPLAYTDTYHVRSRYKDDDGVIMEGNYIIFKGENRLPKISPVSFGPSEIQQTGTMVSIPIGDKDIARINERTRFFASYLPTPPKGFDKIEYEFKSEHGGLRAKSKVNEEMRGVRLIVGGVPYPMPSGLGALNNDVPFDIFFTVGELSPTLSRDAINADEAAVDVIKARHKQFYEEFVEGIKKEISAEPSIIDAYTRMNVIMKRLPYGSRVFSKEFREKFTHLRSDDILAVGKSDFNIHVVKSNIDRYSYDALDIETKTVRSIQGLRIRDLSGSGIVQRRAGVGYKHDESIDLDDFIGNPYGNVHENPQIVLFAMKAPYVTGQIKLIKEAIAAKIVEGRTADATTGKAKLGKSVVALLIQYDDIDDAKAIAKLISPKLELNIITDNSKRTSAHSYMNVIAASATKYSATTPMKLKKLQDDDTLRFMIRKPSWKAHDVHRIMDVLRYMTLFKDKTLVAIQEPDRATVGDNAKFIEDDILQHLKKFGYPLDLGAANAQLAAVRALNVSVDGGILSRVVDQEHDKGTVLERLVKNEKLKDDKELNALHARMTERKVIDEGPFHEIVNTITAVKRLNEENFFTKPIPQGTRPWPKVPEANRKAVEDFRQKYPLVSIISEHRRHQYGGYGLARTIFDAIVDYMESKNRNCESNDAKS